jgi:threonylcarbamoyladenosine tRNA methylthiotransferase MtaB
MKEAGVESDVIRDNATRAGLQAATIVNTCAVTNEAVAQARQTIRRLKRERADVPVIVTGCAAQTNPKMFADMPEVSRVLGNHDKLTADAFATRTDDARKIIVSDIMQVTDTSATPAASHDGRTRAFLQIQNGCDHRCTFCIIPFGRGNSRSVSVHDVIAQARSLVAEGFCEIVLTGVDITSYGDEAAGVPKLGTLVKQILRDVPDLARLRLSSIDSIEADHDLIDTFANDARLMPHLHLSLQAGDDMILKRMKRRHARGDAISFCETLRRLRPDIVFGADIIAGFPTETAEMFARSRDLVDDCGLTHLHVFPFSPRPGTPAARMPQVPGDVIKQRARVLRAAGDAALRRHLDREVGSTRNVLTERGNTGRTEQFTQVRFGGDIAPGKIVRAGIASHDGRALIAA